MKLSIVRLFIFFLLIFIAVQPASAEKRVALVIGNSAYMHTAELPNPKNDAKALSVVLKRLGFEVLGGNDLTRAKFERAVVNFSRKLSSADVGLFFYAGHGLQVGGKNYLVPIDAQLMDEVDLQFAMVKLDDVLAQMERTAKTNLIFIDACRDNPLARTLARAMGRTRSGSIGRGLALVRTGIGTMITFATEPGNVAQDGAGQNSPFTEALLKHIETAGLDIAPMLRNVRRDVIKATRSAQVPWNHSSLTGDFYFKPKGKQKIIKTPPDTSILGQTAANFEQLAKKKNVYVDIKVVLDGKVKGQVMVSNEKDTLRKNVKCGPGEFGRLPMSGGIEYYVKTGDNEGRQIDLSIFPGSRSEHPDNDISCISDSRYPNAAILRIRGLYKANSNDYGDRFVVGLRPISRSNLSAEQIKRLP